MSFLSALLTHGMHMRSQCSRRINPDDDDDDDELPYGLTL